MSLYYCWVTKMANAVVLWVLVYFCVTLVNTKDWASDNQHKDANCHSVWEQYEAEKPKDY